MIKEAALYNFFNSFGVTAYDATTVPDDAVYPRITYDTVIGEIDNTCTITANLWYKSASWVEISQKVNEIAEALKTGDITVPVDGGRMYVTKGSPFAQRMSDTNDDIRRYYLIFQVEFLTNY